MSAPQSQLPFTAAAVLGPGLLGGSVALAVRQRMPGCHIRLWARRQAPLDAAMQMGISHLATTDIAEAVRGADLIVLATPIGAFPQLVSALLPALAPHALVTDVGSVKVAVHQTAGLAIARSGHFFIGSHPMAGAEKQGLEHARADLLQGATVALTNAHNAPAKLMARLRSFWQALGCRTCEMTPEAHDTAVARISHMPHVVAALCARAAVRSSDHAENLRLLAASGFRDTTRVSSGNPEMWADILRSNAPALCAALSDCISDLQEIKSLLEQQNEQAICSWLKQAKEARDSVQR